MKPTLEQKELKPTYLVQRLRAPLDFANPFAFGDGLQNGGLSDNAYELLKGIFSFDYMGAAEYEFGIIPKFFQKLAIERTKYTTWQVFINKNPVYVIAPTELRNLVDERIKEIAKKSAGTYQSSIKCGCDLNIAVGLHPIKPKESCRTIGYLELDNNFAFFVKKETADNFVNLFSITPYE
jgi:hypothetical protein